MPLFLFITSCGFAFPRPQVLVLANHGGKAATAASVMGAVNVGSAGLISPIVGQFGIRNAVPMGAVMGVTAAVSLVIMTVIVRPGSVPALAH
ncbi:MAG: Bcr/CflA family efflux transporter [Microbacteriaceae bacterium]|jgi:DHA1 family bicyclomycin/chloramphenicol resistance-like MFS transporter|nr:Bcr/CflA family efflux transporter [Microbacteriaceae bacterium]